MSESEEIDGTTLIDSMKLAYVLFQFARMGVSSDTLLDTAARTLDRVKVAGTLLVEVPKAWVAPLDEYSKGEITVMEGTVSLHLSELSDDEHKLMSAIQRAVEELSRLFSSGAIAALRSLGYAIHPLPGLVGSSEAFDRDMFDFSFRIAAFHWSELSPEIQQELCELRGIERASVEELLSQEGYAIDMYGERDQ